MPDRRSFAESFALVFGAAPVGPHKPRRRASLHPKPSFFTRMGGFRTIHVFQCSSWVTWLPRRDHVETSAARIFERVKATGGTASWVTASIEERLSHSQAPTVIRQTTSRDGYCIQVRLLPSNVRWQRVRMSYPRVRERRQAGRRPANRTTGREPAAPANLPASGSCAIKRLLAKRGPLENRHSPPPSRLVVLFRPLWLSPGTSHACCRRSCDHGKFRRRRDARARCRRARLAPGFSLPISSKRC